MQYSRNYLSLALCVFSAAYFMTRDYYSCYRIPNNNRLETHSFSLYRFSMMSQYECIPDTLLPSLPLVPWRSLRSFSLLNVAVHWYSLFRWAQANKDDCAIWLYLIKTVNIHSIRRFEITKNRMPLTNFSFHGTFHSVKI